MDVAVWRGTAGSGGFSHYRVPRQPSQTVLDVVTWIQRHVEPTLSYRFACRVGMCGSCAMMVNGEPRWTCRTHVQKVLAAGSLQISPLANLPVIKDLAVDMGDFFDKWLRAEARFHPSLSRNDDIQKVNPDTPARRAASAAIECINCAVCYAACDSVRLNPDYVGPAALNRAWTLVNDERDGGYRVRLNAIGGTAGCFNCHSQQGCASYCPNELNPTASIAALKRTVTRSALRGDLEQT
ncbi:MAG: hypothetical protein CMO26_01120 [Thiotrichales bacterium]|nr:hypothetical protein [Thiotrichales bacterium]|tara:strand:- start:290 stop:1006 length:717 start_codon:yes stop_codon:yes gene_type:complete